MANIKAHFIPSSPEFNELYDDIWMFCSATILLEVIKEIETQHKCIIAACQSNRGCINNYADYSSIT